MASHLSGFSISLFDLAQSAMSPTQSEIFAESASSRRLQQANMSHRVERHQHRGAATVHGFDQLDQVYNVEDKQNRS